MNRYRLLEVLPHYGAMLLLAFLALEAVTVLVGELNFWIEVAIMAVVIFSYRPAVQALGVGPRAWDDSSEPEE